MTCLKSHKILPVHCHGSRGVAHAYWSARPVTNSLPTALIEHNAHFTVSIEPVFDDDKSKLPSYRFRHSLFVPISFYRSRKIVIGTAQKSLRYCKSNELELFDVYVQFICRLVVAAFLFRVSWSWILLLIINASFGP